MTRYFTVMILAMVIYTSGCISNSGHSDDQRDRSQVLIILKTAEYQDTNETIVIGNALYEAGFRAVIATPQGDAIIHENLDKPLRFMNLEDVSVSDFAAVVIPSDNRKNLYHGEESSHRETLRILSEAGELGIIVVAQRWGVVALAESGLLEGRDFAFPEDPLNDPRFIQGNRIDSPAGNIVRDNNIITSSSCPYVNPGIDIVEFLIEALETQD